MNILIAAGGTGGHVFPALCVANSLRDMGHHVICATDSRGNAYLSGFTGIKIIQNISYSTRTILYISLLINTIKCIGKLLLNRPDCVVGFGGYPSIPFVLAAQLLFIRTVIHEQNAVIGKANKILSFAADRMITSFPDVMPSSCDRKTVLIGNPTRFEKEYDAARPSGTDSFTILIFGGSQGARLFAGVVSDAICKLAANMKLKIYHQVRTEDIDALRRKYKASGVDYVVSPFFENIGELYKLSVLGISRSGASSIFEIIGFRIPAILIPYKKSINGDQLANARFLERHDAAVVIDEDDLTAEMLVNAIEQLIEDPTRLQNISQQLERLYVTDITTKCADAIIDNTTRYT
ncbi:MAG: UDP-N-acetylglucosamine--N-acetylmuramyl-(pentapeptide) pyrophosphoryl-undecaprenol N-acetylglucosamine transferase [Holosporales bacterium]|jgi:UDP-N-acetylglucosamine--N-acetylmuramyl-(pentapeptide) pyrophosphoryl-undecaprenol N-acetylglucosamine transferase|nr:UDP-N-acetylglucosamine--N-acetylmuramyl-(pentapeptide) pyrophosphoryl-undecaprenol N-acetylglucosamine transferase [Holosporales bacterium]